jgi:aryl-alcohol dehydrogenase-like predicted oxidoreductase
MTNALERFALGAWQLGGASSINGRANGWGEFAEPAAHDLLLACHSAGIEYIDTAAAYGNGESEARIGRFWPDQTVGICSKIMPEPGASPEAAFSLNYVQASLTASLQRLQRNSIDTLLLHNPDCSALPDPAPFKQLQQAGLIQHFGVSARDRHSAQRAIDAGFGDTIELQYNALDRRSEPMIAAATQLGIRVFLRGVLASGYLSELPPQLSEADYRSLASSAQQSWMQAASSALAFLDQAPGGRAVSVIRFAMRQPVTRILIGMRSKKRLTDLQLAASLGPLSDTLTAQIEAAVPVPFSGWL